MTSGWDVYYVLFLSASLALVLPLALALISFVMTGRRKKSVAPTPDPFSVADDLSNATEATKKIYIKASAQVGRRINTRFFLGANAALVLVTFGLTFIPCVGMLQPDSGRTQALGALGIIFTLVLLSGLGLLYSARKGNLSWLDTFRGEKR